MYCPQCSHQSVSEGLRFCPGCGFRLDAIADLLRNDGIAVREETPPPRTSPFKWGTLLGITLMYLSALLIKLDIPLGPYRGESMAFLTLFWAALVILVSVAGPLKSAIAKVFAKGKTPVSTRDTSSNVTALPSAQGVPITGAGGPRQKTAPIAPPPSVTEATTSLLDNK